MKKLICILLFLPSFCFAQEKIILKYEKGILYQYSDLYEQYFPTLDYNLQINKNKIIVFHYDNKNYTAVSTENKLKVKETYANRTIIKIKLIENQTIKLILTEILN